MKITKLGHCCLLIEDNGVRILTDPGSFTTTQNDLKNIGIVLITHEHQDHFHLESLKTILANNAQAVVVTNSAVGKLLDAQSIKYQIVAEGQNAQINNILIEGFGHTHAEIYQEYGLVENTGYFINNKLFYPGDQFTNPGKLVDILACPAAGPWMRVSEAIDYAKQIKPRICFPVHDGMIIPSAHFALHLFEVFLAKDNVQFVKIELGKETEF